MEKSKLPVYIVERLPIMAKTLNGKVVIPDQLCS